MNKKALLFLGLALAVLAGLSMVMRPASAPTQNSATVVQSGPVTVIAAPAVPELPKPKLFEIVVSKGQRVSGPASIQVQEGDDVELQITSDHADDLHMHGYDLHLKLQAGVPAKLAFKAEHSGRFDYELHHAHLELGTLEVMPK
ncbi:MAG: hypothetical protein V4607_15625 [Pseudomonadota bacterium]